MTTNNGLWGQFSDFTSQNKGLSIGMGVIMPHNFWGFLGVFFANAVCALSILYVMWVGPKFGWKIKTFLRNEI